MRQRVSMNRLNIARYEYRSVAGKICGIVREVGFVIPDLTGLSYSIVNEFEHEIEAV